MASGYKIFYVDSPYTGKYDLYPAVARKLLPPYDLKERNHRQKGYGPFSAFYTLADAQRYDLTLHYQDKLIFEVEGRKSRCSRVYLPINLYDKQKSILDMHYLLVNTNIDRKHRICWLRPRFLEPILFLDTFKIKRVVVGPPSAVDYFRELLTEGK